MTAQKGFLIMTQNLGVTKERCYSLLERRTWAEIEQESQRAN